MQKFYLFSVLFFKLASAMAQQSVLPVPIHIQNGDTVLLVCGRVYSGELDLSHKYRVSVKTEGGCGSAAITPAQPVLGWVKDTHNSSIWWAALDFQPAQIQINGEFITQAHYPNRPQDWASGRAVMPTGLRYRMPDDDLKGATLVWRAADWLIQTRHIARYENGVIFLEPAVDDAFPLLPETQFYVEGKRWMLDSPGEWVYADGKLFVWAPDGKSPEGRTWAAPRARAINASGSHEVQIQGVKIFAATLGIDGSDATDLQIADSEIRNSGEDAILAGGSGLRVQRVSIINTVQNGLRANDDARDVLIEDSQIVGAGMLGMPRRSKGALVFEQASGQRIVRNRIQDAAYIGIRVFRDALVADNVIERACLRLSDCGGIYTFARDRQPLHVRIERNTVSKLGQRMGYAIYLDDFANGVIVEGNLLENNPGGMQLHNAFANVIRHNIFRNNRYEQILMNETGEVASIQQNRIAHNRFESATAAPIFRLWSELGGVQVRRFAAFDDNVYVSTSSMFAEVAGRGMISFRE
jgi:parallel beta-helix repeat protein